MNHPVRPFAHGLNIAFRREVFQKIGGFDPRFPGGGWENADLCWRFFSGTDFQLVHAPKAAVFHHYRTAAKDFFIIHMKYGYRLSLFFSNYREELSWGWRQRLRVYADLGKAAWALGGVGLRRMLRFDDGASLETTYFDFLRQLGQRIGFFHGTLSR
jgi:GT2 family glycosyltransferase